MGKRSIKIQLNPDSRLPRSEDTPQRVDFSLRNPTFEDFRENLSNSNGYPLDRIRGGGYPWTPPFGGSVFVRTDQKPILNPTRIFKTRGVPRENEQNRAKNLFLPEFLVLQRQNLHCERIWVFLDPIMAVLSML
jgi:hypothetical protein